MIGALPMYHSIRWGEIHTLLFKNTSKRLKMDIFNEPFQLL